MSNRHQHETATPDAQAQEAHLESHGASVPFYTFIAVVLGIITYIEFAIVEHQDTWFVWLSRFWIFFWLILLSVVKFLLVVMFFMHLKQDHRAFTGFFTSGMVIAVGTLIALGALFTVRSVAEAQATPEPHIAHADELHAVPERDERTLIERLEYPAPKTQDARAGLAQTIPGSEGVSGSGLQAEVLPSDPEGTGENGVPDASTADPDTTPTGTRSATLPPADPAPPVTLPDPFGVDDQTESEGEAERDEAEDREAAPSDPTVRSVAEAHVLPDVVQAEDERTLIERLEYPAPKTQDARAGLAQTIPGSEGMGGSGLQANVLPTDPSTDAEETAPDASTADPDTTPTGTRSASTLPLADPAPPITLPDPFSPGSAEEQAGAQASEPETAPEGEATEETAPAETAPEETAGDDAASSTEGPLLSEADLSTGETVYSTNCAACHQAEGQGVPGAFPPLAGHTPELALPEGGRDYLVNVLLYGLQGEIEVDGQSYNGVMPAWQQLSDEELAGVLNYTLSSWGNLEAMPEDYAAFSAEEVAEQRDVGLSAAQVYEQRQALELP